MCSLGRFRCQYHSSNYLRIHSLQYSILGVIETSVHTYSFFCDFKLNVFILVFKCQIERSKVQLTLEQCAGAGVWGVVRALTLCPVKNSCIIYSWPSILAVPPYPLFRICHFNQPWLVYYCSIYYWKKSAYKGTRAFQTHVV